MIRSYPLLDVLLEPLNWLALSALSETSTSLVCVDVIHDASGALCS